MLFNAHWLKVTMSSSYNRTTFLFSYIKLLRDIENELLNVMILTTIYKQENLCLWVDGEC